MSYGLTKLFRPGRRGTACRAPTLFNDGQYPVDMVRHDNELVQPDTGKMIRDSLPAFGCNLPVSAQPHLHVDDLPKQTVPPLGADSYEIRSRLGVVVCL